MPHPSDGELLAAYRGGDRAAFGVLVERHQSALLRHARGLLGAGSEYEDVVQEAFLKLARNPPDLGGTDQLPSWLHKVTRNGCMDVLRKDTRRRTREQRVAAAEAGDGGLAVVDGDDTRALVERELARLPGDQREVLVLRLLGERSYKEIAEITGKKVGTVGWLVSVGLKALAERLAPVVGDARASSNDGRVPFGTLGHGGLAQGEMS